MIKLIPIIMILLLIPIVSASDISVTPNNFDIHLYGGESWNTTITATWNGATSIVAYSNYTKIEGLAVNTSEKVIIEPNIPLTIPVEFIALPNLAPDNYTIEIWFTVSVEKIVEVIHENNGGGTRYIYLPYDPADNTTTIETTTTTSIIPTTTVETTIMNVDEDVNLDFFVAVLIIIGLIILFCVGVYLIRL